MRLSCPTSPGINDHTNTEVWLHQLSGVASSGGSVCIRKLSLRSIGWEGQGRYCPATIVWLGTAWPKQSEWIVPGNNSQGGYCLATTLRVGTAWPQQSGQVLPSHNSQDAYCLAITVMVGTAWSQKSGWVLPGHNSQHGYCPATKVRVDTAQPQVRMGIAWAQVSMGTTQPQQSGWVLPSHNSQCELSTAWPQQSRCLIYSNYRSCYI